MHKRIGILGGISYESTKQYYELIHKKYYNRKHDYYFPEVVVFSLNFQWFTDYENSDKKQYIEYILEGIRGLEATGVDCIVMAANSPHSVYSDLVTQTPIPIYSISDVTIKKAQELKLKNILLLGIKHTKEISRHTAKRLLSIQEKADFVIILGGDCSILLGIFGAFRLADKRVGLVILDGHTDYRDPASSSTGEPADLELTILTGRGPRELTGLFGLSPLLRPADVVVYGYRKPDLIAESSILHYDRRVFRETSAENLAIQAPSLLDHVDRLWLHFDVDVLDPALMPVCFPEPDGLSIEETLDFLSTSIRSKRFMGISVSCYHPNLDSNLKAASMVLGMLGSALSSGE